MFVVVSIFGVIAYRIRQREKSASQLGRFFQGIVILSYLCFGAIVCSIDQLITSNITPFLIACTGLAVTLLMSPVSAVVYYGVSYVLLYHIVSWSQPNQEILLSVRVNSISAAGIGFGVALMMWRNNVMRIKQNMQIEAHRIELEKKNKQLERLAIQDPLTGLLNRTAFLQCVNKEIGRIRDTASEAALILMDIDYFKQINDNFGHPVGDRILIDISEMLTRLLRKNDIAARFGGEEFIILLPETSQQDAQKVAEKLRAGIEAYSITTQGEAPQVTASFGVAPLIADEADPFNSCYSKADKALYYAKQKGRNCIETV
jgi:diguanylate cyclase (GGDEF)-like protein